MSDLNILKLTQSIDNALNNADESNVASQEDRYTLVSALVGGVVGSSLAIPVEPVNNISVYLHDTHYKTISAVISKINEAYAIDLDTAQAACESVYKERYNLVHLGYSISARRILGMIESESHAPELMSLPTITSNVQETTLDNVVLHLKNLVKEV